jgi:hypothetical protein
MIDTTNWVTINEDEQFPVPPPARFDDDASANARPVQPLPASGIGLWTQRLRDARQKFSGRTRGLALVMISGLTIGAASGAMLASRHQALVSTSVVQQSTDEAAAPEASSQETQATLPTSDMIGAEGSAMAMQSAGKARRIRRQRFSLRAPVQPRAYRVGILK